MEAAKVYSRQLSGILGAINRVRDARLNLANGEWVKADRQLAEAQKQLDEARDIELNSQNSAS